MKHEYANWSARLVALALLLNVIPAFGAEPTAPLKSAKELADYLQTRIGVAFDIPTVFPSDVLTAEQRDGKAIVFKSGHNWDASGSVSWEWDPQDALPSENKSWFSNISEVKPSRGCAEILVAASGGGVARVRLADSKLLFYGYAGGNTHSIAMLPDANIVSASSTGGYLCLFAVPLDSEETGASGPTPVYKRYELKDAHGVVWDAKRSTLWALGGEELVGYSYEGTKTEPELKEKLRVKLEGTAVNGHDLYPAPGYDALMTTGAGVNVFDPNGRKFYPVSKMRGVKSISLDANGTPLIQRAVTEWWSETIFFGDANDSPVGTCSGAKFYKARWFTPNEFSEME